MNMSNDFNLENVAHSFSTKRFHKFKEFYGKPHCIVSAMELYSWNARVAAAFMLPLHICEVVIRNAINEALINVYGSDWIKDAGFIRSLPRLSKEELLRVTRLFDTVDKVIPELKLVFWQHMLTTRHSVRVWNEHLFSVFPNGTDHFTVPELLLDMNNSLKRIRLFRNRIAHHENLIARDLNLDYEHITKLISYRCVDTLNWLSSIDIVPCLLDNKPIRQNIMRSLVYASHYQPVLRGLYDKS